MGSVDLMPIFALNDRWRGGIGGNIGNGDNDDIGANVGNGGSDNGGWDVIVFDGETVWLATVDGTFGSTGFSCMWMAVRSSMNGFNDGFATAGEIFFSGVDCTEWLFCNGTSVSCSDTWIGSWIGTWISSNGTWFAFSAHSMIDFSRVRFWYRILQCFC